MLLDKPYYDYDFEGKDIIEERKQERVGKGVQILEEMKPMPVEKAKSIWARFGITGSTPNHIPDMSNEELQEFVKKEEIKKQNKNI